VRAGDLLFVSNLMAVSATCSVRPGDQMESILDAAERLCKKAGTSLENAVRVQQFHTDLADFQSAWRAWDRRLPRQSLPFSAIEVPALGVPGATVMLDLWVYVP
jgi:enamine deaminase RidA (YjgF/YER057c/UK114 family)